jgi:hypothetical protein
LTGSGKSADAALRSRSSSAGLPLARGVYQSIARRRKRLQDRLARQGRCLRDPTASLEVAEEVWKLDEEDLEELDDRPEEVLR